jgi:hypothetical protein
MDLPAQGFMAGMNCGKIFLEDRENFVKIFHFAPP